MSIRKSRAGRKSWQTRESFNSAVVEAATAIGKGEWKHDDKTTKAMIIERKTPDGKTEVITFSQAYGELSMWLNVAFANISQDGFSDMLADTFFQGAIVRTKKAEYQLKNKSAFVTEAAGKPAANCFWCLDETIEGKTDEPIYCAFCGRRSESDFINWATGEIGNHYFHQAGEVDRIYQDIV